ncbi:hypothetical protein MLD52_09190 [Puniceicoccaceae bacterium K14]|nr:hypothetical protein [Puniceicoccaceae bacterium K14]
MSLQHVKMRLRSVDRLRARRELERLNTLVRIQDAVNDGKKGNKKLMKYAKKLEKNAGWGLAPEQEREEAAVNAVDFIESMKKAEKRKAMAERTGK